MQWKSGYCTAQFWWETQQAVRWIVCSADRNRRKEDEPQKAKSRMKASGWGARAISCQLIRADLNSQEFWKPILKHSHYYKLTNIYNINKSTLKTKSINTQNVLPLNYFTVIYALLITYKEILWKDKLKSISAQLYV